MKLVSSTARLASVLSCRTQLPWTIRSIFTDKSLGDGMNDNKGGNSYESADDFEQRIFGGALDNNSRNGSFFDKLDRLRKVRGKSHVGSREIGGASGQLNEGLGESFDTLSDGMDGASGQLNEGLGESFDTLSDGMDGKLKKAATTFVYGGEIKDVDYSFRPDVNFRPGMTYALRDLDLTKSVAQKPYRRPEFETTTGEVLKKADFRNVRFLANFLTEAGLIIKRKKTRISAKAQRKVAREIKTARAFGLLPFTTMGTKQFQFGKSMEDLDEDMEYDNFYSQPVTDYFEDKRNM